MKFQVKANDLLEAVTDALKGVSGRSAVQMLGGVLVEAGAGTVTVSGTDLELTVASRCPAKVAKTGSVVVAQPKGLAAALKEMGSDAALVELDGDKLRVERGPLKASFPLYVRDEYVKLPKVGEPTMVDAKRLLDQLRAVLPAASTDDSRPVLTGVKLEATAGALTIAATDSYRLHVHTEQDMLPVELERDVIVPQRALALFAKLARKQPEIGVSVVKVGTGARVGFHVNGRVTVTVRAIDGQFPNYRQLIPDAFEALPLVNRERLLAAVRVVDRLCGERNAPVLLGFAAGGSICVSGEMYDGPSVEENVALEEPGWPLAEPAVIGLNGPFFAGCLEMFPNAEHVELGFISPLRPIIVRVPGSSGASALIMPIRLAT